MEDNLRTLLFDTAACRAQVVSLGKAWQVIQSHHDYPAPVTQLLGELVAASSLLSASLKFEGSIVIQIQGDGPVRLLVAECSNTLGVRATVKLRENAEVKASDGFKELCNEHGKGLCVLILDPKNRVPGQQPYQGIVSLNGESIAQCLEEYMEHSEQLKTRIQLYSNEAACSGLMIQEMPSEGGISVKNYDPEGWDTLIALAGTATSEEMLKLDSLEMSRRLFSDQTPEILADRPLKFECTCSRKKVSRMLLNLGPEEVNAALDEHPHISVHCEFCNSAYVFTRQQCDRLFSNDDELDPPDESLLNEVGDANGITRDGSPPTLH